MEHDLIVRQHLTQTFGEQWMARGGPVNWPTRSPNLSPLGTPEVSGTEQGLRENLSMARF
jgi:hypothetical protein